MKSNKHLPDAPKPVWQVNKTLTHYQALEENIEADVVVVGGGIAGITSAYLLANEGIRVVLLEANQLLHGTTGHTTAKITAQHDLIYDEFLNHFGKEKAQQYYQANTEALQFIKQTVEKASISCSFSEEDAYLYATTPEYARKLTNEMRAYQQLGIHGEFVNSLPLDLTIKAGILMRNQAQFDPVAYLKPLVEKFVEMGGQVYERTVAIDVQQGTKPVVVTKNGPTVTCNHVLACSHFPFYDGNALYFSRMYAEASYVVAATTKEPFPGGMYLSAEDPKRSLRSHTFSGEKLVLFGGESHKTGQGNRLSDHYKALKFFAEETLGVKEIAYRWSAEDFYTLDKLPYIGPVTNKQSNVLIATGFHKWGMTNGTAAALLFKDYVLGNDNPYKELFSPSRFYADPSIKTFMVQNADVAGHFVKGKLSIPKKKISELQDDEGAVVRINGRRAGAYKDSDGAVHLVDTTCTHLYCEVEWNDGDRTWDCPCHGSRFGYDGKVVEGPADRPLTNLSDELE